MADTDAGKDKKKGVHSSDITLGKDNDKQHEREGSFRLPLVWIDLEMTGKLSIFYFFTKKKNCFGSPL